MVRDDLFLPKPRKSGHNSAFVISVALHASLFCLLLRSGSSAIHSPGSGGNRSGGPRAAGSGATSPRLIRQVPPQYTSEAMRARIQGVARARCIVRPTGTPTDCEISRSLDSTFGLDQEALKAARLWQFMPGTLGGERVNVPVVIEMTFSLR
jgi:TonB family protein